MRRFYFALLTFFALFMWFSTSQAECIAGEKMLHNEQDSTRRAIGRESIKFDHSTKNISLRVVPDYADTQIYLMVDSVDGFGAMLPEDWCYDTDKNSIEFLRWPRFTPIFSNAVLDVPPGSEVWAGYHGSQEKDPLCIPGLFLNYLAGGPDGSTYGQEYFHYKEGDTKYALTQVPLEGHQMYLYAGSMWVYGFDWCYSESDNRIHFLRDPIRIYNWGALPGSEIGNDIIIWAGYVPKENPAKKGMSLPTPNFLPH